MIFYTRPLHGAADTAYQLDGSFLTWLKDEAVVVAEGLHFFKALCTLIGVASKAQPAAVMATVRGMVFTHVCFSKDWGTEHLCVLRMKHEFVLVVNCFDNT